MTGGQMIRLLIIGRPCAGWAQRIEEVAGDGLEIDTARLPSAGIRQFESSPPDLIAIVDDRGGTRVETLVHAIRKRPLGQLVPLILICPLPEDHPLEERVEALELAGWLTTETSPDSVLALIEEELDVGLRSLKSQGADKAARPTSESAGEASYFDGDIVLEPLDFEPEEVPGTRQIARNSIFRGSTSGPSLGSLEAEEIKRKLRAVRHEDYYAILELRRGAESQAVREAFHRLASRFDPQSLDFELAHRFQDEIDEIRDALEDAFAVLGDPGLREPYLRHTVK